MTTNTIATTETILGKHLQAIFARDLDAILSDYVEESVLFTQNGTFKGLEAIRGFFTFALTIFTPEVIATMNLSKQDIHGEYAYIVWTAGATVLMGSDTFLIRNGKIIMQSFAAQFGD
jgi:ketosteroid isomerase-like protein